MIIAVMNAIKAIAIKAIGFITAMIVAYLISNPQFNIWNISYITWLLLLLLFSSGILGINNEALTKSFHEMPLTCLISDLVFNLCFM